MHVNKFLKNAHSMKRIIINADDYGFDRNRSEAIRECFGNGLLTQTTAMVNMPYCPTAIQHSRHDGFFDKIGLHLNLTFGMPLTDGIRKSRLFCHEDGHFSGAFHRSKFWRLWLPQFEREVVRTEIRAQMLRYKEFGLPLMHIDSHHHAHTDPAVLGIVLSLASEMGFHTIRISRNVPSAKQTIHKKLIKSLVNRQIKATGLAHSDYFGSVVEVANCIKKLPSGASVEIMVHPLYSTGPDMELNREYDAIHGNLCDSTILLQEVFESIKAIRRA